MRPYLFICTIFLFLFTFSSCKKQASSPPSPNPNIIDGCEIVQVQVIQTFLNSSHSPYSYIDYYQYDSLGRVTSVGDGQYNDTNHYQYNNNGCDGDHNSRWNNSANGYLASSTDPTGSYQYSYDGNGYLQSLIYVDSVDQGSNQSYTETYYWDSNNNLSYTVRLSRSQSTPVTTTYTYYTDKPNQVLIPSCAQTGRPSADLPMQMVVTSNGNTISTDSYTYTFDINGKVTQYIDLAPGKTQTRYTLVYSCH